MFVKFSRKLLNIKKKRMLPTTGLKFYRWLASNVKIIILKKISIFYFLLSSISPKCKILKFKQCNWI